MHTVNDQVMVAPIEFNLEKNAPSRGWVQNEKISNALVSTTVLADSKQFKTGDTVYVRASEVSQNAFVKNIYEFNGTKCLIMPEAFVVLVDSGKSSRPEPLPLSGPGR